MAVGLEHAQIESLFALSPPAAAFATLEAALDRYVGAENIELRRHILDALDARLTRHDGVNETFIEAVFAASAHYLRVEQGDAKEDRASLAIRLNALVGAAFNDFGLDARVSIMRALLPKLADLSLACMLLGADAQQYNAETLFGTGADELRALLSQGVEAIATRGTLWRQAKPQVVLWFWWSVAQGDRVYAFVKASMRDEQALAALLGMLVEPSAVSGGDVVAVRRWSKIIDFQSLEQAALRLVVSGATRANRRSASRFLEAFGNGKSELFR